ncbi:uncharacterized protein [Nicotiana tomentosiformis]|uniref:uncharacterized protein n=1 Tax=Nicotiana tomentosiformis TaxID=4098 RepID=UPI00388CB687
MGVAESSGVSFTTFQLRGADYHWWRAYELGGPAEAASLTWTQFSDMFSGEYVPQSLGDSWRAEFEQLCQGSMTVSEYAVRFSDLARNAPALVATIREWVHQFIEGNSPSIRFSMAQELEMDITYQQVVGIARILEGMLTREREEREAKRSRESGTYNGTYAPTAARQGRGYVGRPVHLALPVPSGAPSTPRPQAPYYAPTLSSAPSAWGSFSGQSRRSGPSQSQEPCPLRAYFKCGDTLYVVRDCPRLGRGAPPQATQAPRAPPVL